MSPRESHREASGLTGSQELPVLSVALVPSTLGKPLSAWTPGFEEEADELMREEGQRGVENSLRT